MTQPTPKVTIEDVFRIVKRDFDSPHHKNVIEILNQYGVWEYQNEHNRVRAAILKIANGNLELLKNVLEIAKNDYRDVLLRAEYPMYLNNITNKDFSKKEMYELDWKQYVEWFEKS